MGTAIQKVYDAFFIKAPDTNFEGQEDLVYQLLQTAIGYSYKTVPESLEYVYDEVAHEGYFIDDLYFDSIQLIALYMSREHYRRTMNRLSAIKQSMGTQNFNKLPDAVKQLDSSISFFNNMNDEITGFRQEFYKYDNN